MNDLESLEKQLGVPFNDYSLLARALTHRSFVNEHPDMADEDNERLEFLGDAVLDFVVGAHLFHRFPEKREGELTMYRAALVRTETLAGFAQKLGIGQVMRLGAGEAESGGRQRIPTLCAAFEAIVGALFLDQGLEVVEAWLQQFIGPALAEIVAAAAHVDAKSEFQIWAQGLFNITPRYQVLAAEGPDHEKIFTVAVQIETETWGIGRGRNKQAAEQMAASAALEKAAEYQLDVPRPDS